MLKAVCLWRALIDVPSFLSYNYNTELKTILKENIGLLGWG
jgi:hypothetical protein